MRALPSSWRRQWTIPNWNCPVWLTCLACWMRGPAFCPLCPGIHESAIEEDKMPTFSHLSSRPPSTVILPFLPLTSVPSRRTIASLLLTQSAVVSLTVRTVVIPQGMSSADLGFSSLSDGIWHSLRHFQVPAVYSFFHLTVYSDGTMPYSWFELWWNWCSEWGQ